MSVGQAQHTCKITVFAGWIHDFVVPERQNAHDYVFFADFTRAAYLLTSGLFLGGGHCTACFEIKNGD